MNQICDSYNKLFINASNVNFKTIDLCRLNPKGENKFAPLNFHSSF